MTTDIFIRTYAGDVDWLPYCLASIAKYCHGFNAVYVACPKADGLIVFPCVHRFHFHPVETFGEQPGYLCQQATKMEADQWCRSPYIMYVDSDCVFTTENTPETHFRDGKPMMLVTPYEKVGEAICWKPLTERMLGFECKYETMRRHPSVWHRDTVARCAEHIRHFTGEPTIRRAVMKSGGFSEFNALGSWALQFQSDRYCVINTEEPNADIPPLVLKQFWSHSRITAEEKTWMKNVIA